MNGTADMSWEAVAASVAAGLVILALLITAGFVLLRRNRRDKDAPNESTAYAGAAGERLQPGQLETSTDGTRSLRLRRLESHEREGFARRWLEVQADFVDHPVDAVLRADALLVELMRTRGFDAAAEGPDRRATDLAMLGPERAEDYRDLHSVAARARSGTASTEDLRVGMRRLRRVYESVMNHSYDDGVYNDTRQPVEAR